MQPGSVASDDAKSSVSTKHITKETNVWPVFCHVCQISCESKVAYANHICGKIHQQKRERMFERDAMLSKENAERLEKVLSKSQTAFASQNHAAMVKEQTEASFITFTILFSLTNLKSASFFFYCQYCKAYKRLLRFYSHLKYEVYIRLHSSIYIVRQRERS